MKILSFPILLCGAVACATLTVTLLERERRESEVADLRRKVADLNASRSTDDAARTAPERVVYLASAVPTGAPARSALAPSSTTTPIAPAEAPRARKPAEARDTFEVAFTGDRADPSWTELDKRRATEKVEASLPPTSQLRSLDCRASFCRIETSHADLSTYRTFLRTFSSPATAMWSGDTFSTKLNDETAPGEPYVMVSYISREGQRLPHLD